MSGPPPSSDHFLDAARRHPVSQAVDPRTLALLCELDGTRRDEVLGEVLEHAQGIDGEAVRKALGVIHQDACRLADRDARVNGIRANGVDALAMAPRVVGEDFLRKAIAPRRYIVQGRVQRRVVRGLVAAGGTGKTSHLLLRGVSIVSGRPLLGEAIIESVSVMVILGEEDFDEIERRLQAICLHYSVAARELAGRLHYFSGYGSPFIVADRQPGAGIVHTPRVDQIIDYMREHEIGYLAIDPFISTHRADENDNPEINIVVDAYRHIAIATDAGIDLSHHATKGGGSAGDADAGRGASAFRDACRATYTLSRLPTEVAEKEGIPEDLAQTMYRLDSGKVNYEPSSTVGGEWYRVLGYSLGNASGVHAADSVGVVEPVDIDSVRAAAPPEVDPEAVRQSLRDLVVTTMVREQLDEAPIGDLVGAVMSLLERGSSVARDQLNAAIPLGAGKPGRGLYGDASYLVWRQRQGPHATAPQVIHISRERTYQDVKEGLD